MFRSILMQEQVKKEDNNICRKKANTYRKERAN